ncbi:MAG: serine/threonine-protein kinase, partial [Acidobacteriota bacterium]|nr:serine/threonine-protein kinase [Acidobacteriota bacterium]
MRAGERIGRLRFEELLGSGGSGEVWSAFDETLQRQVAVKVLRRATDHPRLLAEARIVSQLDHPNICRVFDLVEGSEGPLLVMERVNGRSLRRLLDEGLDRRRALELAQQIAEGLATAHAQGITHRDLKPANILVDDQGTVKILDFGLARPSRSPASSDGSGGSDDEAAHPPQEIPEGDELQLPGADSPTWFASRTAPGDILGTPAYMSPEQARGERATPATDVYSFGLLLQEMLTGASPYGRFRGSSRLVILARRGETLPPEGLPGHLSDLVESAKAKAPPDRPTAAQLAARLQKILDRPRVLRRRLVVACVLLLVALGGIKYTLDLRRERNAAVEARQEAQEARLEAEKVTEFLVGLFEQQNPYARSEDPPSVADLLSSGVERADRELVDQPGVRSRLLQTMGRALLGQGRSDEARPVLDTALELARSRPEDRRGLIDAVNAQWSLANQLEKSNRAVELAREALGLVREEFGDQPSTPEGVQETAAALIRLARSLASLEGSEESEALATELIRLMEEDDASGRNALDGAQRLQILHTLAQVRAYRGDLHGSADLLLQAVEVLEGVEGVDQGDQALIPLDLCQMLVAAGRQSEAEEPCRQQRERVLQIFGETHRARVPSLSASASWLKTAGKTEEALEALREAVSVARAVDAGGLLEANVLLSLAGLLSQQANPAAAVPVSQRAWELYRQHLGEENERTLAAALTYGVVLLRNGQASQAEEIFRRLLEPARADYADSRILGSARVQLGIALTRQGRYGECVSSLRQALGELKETYGPDHWRLAAARSALGECLSHTGQQEEAGRLLREAVGQLEEQLGAETETLRRARARLAD